LPALRLTLHPSVRILSSRWPVVAIWVAHQGTGELAAIDLATAQDALIARRAHGLR